jgi:hypothetical protein
LDQIPIFPFFEMAYISNHNSYFRETDPFVFVQRLTIKSFLAKEIIF